jgi:hypothetical protein
MMSRNAPFEVLLTMHKGNFIPGQFSFLNTIISFFLKLHSTFHSLQYLATWSVPFCIPLTAYDPTIKSSAK